LRNVLLHLQELKAHFLDPAVQLAHLLFELLQTHFSAVAACTLTTGAVPRLSAGLSPICSRIDRRRIRRLLGSGQCSEAQHACHDKFLHMVRPVPVILRASMARTGDFSNCFQKATESGQSVVKKKRRPRTDRLSKS
jgi:hypothetical protein